MEIEPKDVIDAAEAAREKREQAASRLNTWVAITIALLATFMGICKIKDDNICQAMQQAQSDRVDYWGYYQAKNTQEKLFEQSASQMRVLAASVSGAAKEIAAKEVATTESEGKRMKTEKAEQKDKAEEADKTYNALNFHDDQFDLSDASISVAIALLALTSLTQKRWLYILALVPTLFGVLMGVAGLLSLRIHPDWLMRLLS